MRFMALSVLALAVALPGAVPASGQTPEDEAKVRAVIAEYYERVSHFEARTPWVLFAPGSIEGGPGYSVPVDRDVDGMKSAAIRGPWLNHELAARALKFTYDIDVLKIDPRLAKAVIWERGYFYASAAQTTYENGASTTFILEKMDDGRWLILGHKSQSLGIPSDKISNPMPDLHDLYYSRCGSACDPAADAKKAKEF